MNLTQDFRLPDNRTISYALQGEGDLLILFHGYLESSAIFTGLLPELAVHFQVLTVDFPGHGNSGLPPEGYSFIDFARELNLLLGYLHLPGKAILAGHSMGGYNALAYSSLFPEKVKQLFLVHASADKAPESHLNRRRRELELIKKGRLELIIRNSLHNNFAPCNHDCFPELHRQLSEMASHVSPEAATRTIYAIMERPSYLDFLNKVSFPVIIFAGKEDKILSHAKQRRESRLIRDATYIVLENCGHVGFIEEKSLFLEKFLNISDEQLRDGS